MSTNQNGDDEGPKPGLLSGIRIPTSVLQPLSLHKEVKKPDAKWHFTAGTQVASSTLHVQDQGFQINASSGIFSKNSASGGCAVGFVQNTNGECTAIGSALPTTTRYTDNSAFWSQNLLSGTALGKQTQQTNKMPFIALERSMPETPGLSVVGVLTANLHPTMESSVAYQENPNVPLANTPIVTSPYYRNQTYGDTFKTWGEDYYKDYFQKFTAETRQSSLSLDAIAKYGQQVGRAGTITAFAGGQADLYGGKQPAVHFSPLGGLAGSVQTGRLTTTLSTTFMGSSGQRIYSPETVAHLVTTYAPGAMNETTKDIVSNAGALDTISSMKLPTTATGELYSHMKNPGAKAMGDIANAAQQKDFNFTGNLGASVRYDIIPGELAAQAGVRVPFGTVKQGNFRYDASGTPEQSDHFENRARNGDFANIELGEIAGDFSLTYTPGGHHGNPAKCPPKPKHRRR